MNLRPVGRLLHQNLVQHIGRCSRLDGENNVSGDLGEHNSIGELLTIQRSRTAPIEHEHANTDRANVQR